MRYWYILQHGWTLQHAKLKKPITEGHMLYDPFISNAQNRQIHRESAVAKGRGMVNNC